MNVLESRSKHELLFIVIILYSSIIFLLDQLYSFTFTFMGSAILQDRAWCGLIWFVKNDYLSCSMFY